MYEMKFSKHGYDLSEPRKTIIKCLKICPAGEWVLFKRFINEIRRRDLRLFGCVGRAVIRHDKHKYWYDADWREFEFLAIGRVLIFLAAMGMVELKLLLEDHDCYGCKSDHVVHYLKLTELGAQFLEMRFPFLTSKSIELCSIKPMLQMIAFRT